MVDDQQVDEGRGGDEEVEEDEEEEENEVLVVCVAQTVVYVGTVVVKLLYTLLTKETMKSKV